MKCHLFILLCLSGCTPESPCRNGRTDRSVRFACYFWSKRIPARNGGHLLPEKTIKYVKCSSCLWQSRLLRKKNLTTSSQHDVHNLLWDDDDFSDCLAFRPFGRFGGGLHGGFNVRIGRCQRHLQFEADFAVERYRIVESVFRQVFLIPGGERGGGHAVGVSEQMPQFFSHVGSEGSDGDNQWLEHGPFVAF